MVKSKFDLILKKPCLEIKLYITYSIFTVHQVFFEWENEMEKEVENMS